MATPLPRQRLVICLDGTWNKRDDRTNVSHHFDLLTEGLVPRRPGSAEQILQRKYYDQGVGTGLLDSISGGGFGVGLEENVREAYDWLSSNYRDHDGRDGDEIFIFGFSRGAYTARSLVGFIGRCGLLRRGAPLSINQLWSAYCIIGRQHEQRSSLTDRLFGREDAPFRELTQLVSDPWDGSQPRAADPTPTEQLLMQWSRRVKITFLGVYDTVGALGIDALAIPTLRSRVALHHNMRPTTLIQKCRHALALDEHRSSFSHTPFIAFSGHGKSRAHGGKMPPPTDAELAKYWGEVAQDWAQRIEQRWFVGAHSNIGGGYDSNVLADLPLRWMLAGACAPDVGLVCEPLRGTPPVPPLPSPRDSFLEFARPFWALLFRAKRNYRRLAPPEEARGSAREKFVNAGRQPGFSLASINEQIDDSVWQHYATCPPPNLIELARRSPQPAAQRIRTATSLHPWMGNGARPYFVTAMFATFASLGIVSAVQFFAPGAGFAPTALWLAAGALLLIAADWGESWMNFKLALDAGPPARRAFRDAIYWTRTICVVLSFCGALHLLGSGWMEGWSVEELVESSLTAPESSRFRDRPVDVAEPVLNRAMFAHALAHPGAQWPAAAGAVGGVLVLLLGGAAGGTRRIGDLLGALGGGAMALLIGPLAIAAGFYAGQLLKPIGINWPLSIASGELEAVTFTSTLLLLQISFLYFVRALAWCSEPMERANLGPIFPLQLGFTPERFRDIFARWRAVLACPWRPSAVQQMAPIVRESLARDTIGFVPVYVLVFTFGLGFGALQLEWTWLDFKLVYDWPVWVVWPCATALFDYLEDALHWLMLRLDEKQQRDPQAPGLDRWWAWGLTLLAGTASQLKFAGGIGAALLTIGAISAGTVTVVADRLDAGWRSIPVLLISTGGAVFMLVTVVGVVWFRWKVGRKFHALSG